MKIITNSIKENIKDFFSYKPLNKKGIAPLVFLGIVAIISLVTAVVASATDTVNKASQSNEGLENAGLLGDAVYKPDVSTATQNSYCNKVCSSGYELTGSCECIPSKAEEGEVTGMGGESEDECSVSKPCPSGKICQNGRCITPTPSGTGDSDVTTISGQPPRPQYYYNIQLADAWVEGENTAGEYVKNPDKIYPGTPITIAFQFRNIGNKNALESYYNFHLNCQYYKKDGSQDWHRVIKNNKIIQIERGKVLTDYWEFGVPSAFEYGATCYYNAILCEGGQISKCYEVPSDIILLGDDAKQIFTFDKYKEFNVEKLQPELAVSGQLRDIGLANLLRIFGGG